MSKSISLTCGTDNELEADSDLSEIKGRYLGKAVRNIIHLMSLFYSHTDVRLLRLLRELNIYSALITVHSPSFHTCIICS